jgi:hypothetical protein
MFKKLCLKEFAIFAVCPLLTVAMAPPIHNTTNNLEKKTFTCNQQSAPPQNRKATLDGTRSQDDMRPLSHRTVYGPHWYLHMLVSS